MRMGSISLVVAVLLWSGTTFAANCTISVKTAAANVAALKCLQARILKLEGVKPPGPPVLAYNDGTMRVEIVAKSRGPLDANKKASVTLKIKITNKHTDYVDVAYNTTPQLIDETGTTNAGTYAGTYEASISGLPDVPSYNSSIAGLGKRIPAKTGATSPFVSFVVKVPTKFPGKTFDFYMEIQRAFNNSTDERVILNFTDVRIP